MADKKEIFSDDFAKFKVKIGNFVLSNNFAEKSKEYEDHFNQMASIAPDDMKEMIAKAPEFLTFRNQSLSIMERIVKIHKDLEEIFAMDETALGLKCNFELSKIDTRIGKDLQMAAKLLHEFGVVSDKGRAVVEQADSPFFSQSM